MTSVTECNLAPFLDKKRLIEHTATAVGELGKLIDSLEDKLLGTQMDARLNTEKTLVNQDIDLISQTVVELGALLSRLSLHTPENMRVAVGDIVDPIRLERLRAIILTGIPQSHGLGMQQPPQPMQLFD